MLKITIEYLPYGEKKDREILAAIAVVNNGKHILRPIFGSYDVTVMVDKRKQTFVINHWERNDGYWCLVHNIMKKVCSGEFKPQKCKQKGHKVR